MRTHPRQGDPATTALELFHARPDLLYSLEAAAELACVPRRAMLVYWRAGLVRPVFLPPYGVMAFTEEAIYAVRRIERLRAVHGFDQVRLVTLVIMLDEVERLRAVSGAAPAGRGGP